MGISVFPAPSAASKTRFLATLTSGTSWTVPAGVTYVIATLFGGGGGGGAGGNNATPGSTGGTTTFTGATSAVGGVGGPAQSRDTSYAGNAAGANSNLGGQGATRSDGGNSTGAAEIGQRGMIISTQVSTTPGSTISYSIGAGGNAGTSGDGSNGGAGGSGRIEIEYWA
jgi:hypothetical protein